MNLDKMNVMTFSQVRSVFKQTLDDVCTHHEPTVITRQRGEHVVMLSLDDYNGILETMHLLASPKNAMRLSQSLESIRSGKAKFRGLLEDERETQKSEQREGEDGPAVLV